jgi:2-iminoacetate synthase
MTPPFDPDLVWRFLDLEEALENRDSSKVETALVRGRKTPRDLALLLSPGADAILEQIANAAHRITEERFGRTIQLYAPLYLTNRCVGDCPYCGFSKKQRIARRALTLSEIRREAAVLRESGMKSLLLVAGDDPNNADVPALSKAVSTVRELVPSVSIEVAPLDVD